MNNKLYSLWLCASIIIIYILQLIIPGFTNLFVLNQSSFPEIWRFVTSIFLHGSLAHLISNLFALALFGFMLEQLIGTKKFLLVFISTGIIANLVAVNFYSSSLGASGAIFGIIGTLIIVRPTLVVWAFGMPMPIFIAGILWAIADTMGLFVPSEVANIAHLSGLAIGLIIGGFLRDWTKKPKLGALKIPENQMRSWEDSYIKNQ